MSKKRKRDGFTSEQARREAELSSLMELEGWTRAEAEEYLNDPNSTPLWKLPAYNYLLLTSDYLGLNSRTDEQRD